MKKLLTVCIAFLVSASVLFGGCVSLSGADGRDGKDGQNASVYDYYELAKSQDPDLTIEEFLREYLNYTDEDIKNSTSLQASINRSLFSAVSIAAGFPKRNSWEDKPWFFGSGVILDEGFDKDNGNAYVVTNCHVIYYDLYEKTANGPISQEVYLFLYGQDADYDIEKCGIEATVVAASQTYDIAVLKVENSEILKNSNASPASFSTKDDVYVGETVYAIGNSEGYGIAATQGIVSKDSELISIDLASSQFNENIKEYRVMRTDAAINSGNSGGGLFYLDGSLAGIVNAKAASDDIDNMGFVLPAGNVRRLLKIMTESMTGGAIKTAGVNRIALVAEFSSYACASKYNNETGKAEICENVYVKTEGDGLKVDDAIRHIKITDASGTVIEDKDVTRLYHLDDTLLSARVGYTVTLTVSRNGEEVAVDILLRSVHNRSFD
ncbi:MAG: S1C family serine protease [Clostridia bacterium]|nr:S1C family serine protease [Clostridia bacterium]